MWWLEKIPRCREKKLKLTKITGSDQSIIVLILSNFVIISHQTKHCCPQETLWPTAFCSISSASFQWRVQWRREQNLQKFLPQGKKRKKKLAKCDGSRKFHNTLLTLCNFCHRSIWKISACRADVILASECFDFNGSGSGERNKSVYQGGGRQSKIRRGVGEWRSFRSPPTSYLHRPL